MVDVYLHLGTKNHKPRTIQVLPGLIKATLDFIEYDRPEIISSRHKNRLDSGEVFVSASSKGSVGLTPQSITNLLAEVGSISPHALRRYALTNYARHLFGIEQRLMEEGGKRGIDERRIELLLAQHAGHESFDTSIKYYVDVARMTSLDIQTTKILEERQIFLDTERCMIASMLADAGERPFALTTT
jgi:integrase